ncbi:MAG: DMT family transporter [Alphaproteobacteria bacterium]
MAIAAGGLPVPLRVGGWMLFTACNFAAMLGVARYLSADLSVFVISFWRNLFAALMLLPLALRFGSTRLPSRSIVIHVARAACLVASSTAMYLAVVQMPIAEVTAISFTTPLFAVLLAALFLNEKLTTTRMIGLGVGFAGVLVMLRPGAAVFDLAAFYVLFSSVTFGGVVIFGRILAMRESAALMVAMLALISVPLSLPPALFVWDWPNLAEVAWLVAMAVFGNLNMYGIVRSLKIAEASQTQPYDFLRLPSTAAVGFLFFAEVPDVFTWVGAAIICAGTVWVTRVESRAARV